MLLHRILGCYGRGMSRDRLSEAARSANMAKVRSKGTKPELTVRKAAHRLGFRFRLHPKALPGTPDLVFPRLRLAVFVHGCFWHQHPGCSRASMPIANASRWAEKFAANCRRDEEAKSKLEALGWRVEVVWECQTRAPGVLAKRLEEALKPA